MSASDPPKNPPSSTPDVPDILQSGHALAQIAAAAHGLEIALEQQFRREQNLKSENDYLRNAGRRLADELTELTLEISHLKETALNESQKLSEIECEKKKLAEEILHKEIRWAHEIESQRAFFSSEILARENKIREEISKIVELSDLEARIQSEKLTAALVDKTAEFEAGRAGREGDLAHFRQESAQLTEALDAANTRVSLSNKKLIALDEESRSKISALENSLSDLTASLRIAHKENGVMLENLNRERAAARATSAELAGIQQAAEIQIERCREEAQGTVRQARREFEIRLKQVESEAKSTGEFLRSEGREHTENYQIEIRKYSEELQLERKRANAAEEARQEAEQKQELTLRDSAARIRHIEKECESLSDELKRTVDASERRIAEIRNERSRANRELRAELR